MEDLMKKCFTFLWVFLIGVSCLAFAQEQTGVLVGVVKDLEGTPLPGVTIEAHSPSYIGTISEVTDTQGRYRLIGLTPGTYSLTYSLPGFATLRREGILVRLGRTFTVDVDLELETQREEVTVIGESPVVDIKKSGSTFNIGKDMFDKLPKGRDFTSVVAITAGANIEDMSGNVAEDVGQEDRVSGVSMDGATGAENMYFIDGVDTTSMYDGMSSQRVVFEFVEEVQVKSSGYEAEHGGSMGGVINVITRSGGNEYHGEVGGYWSGSTLSTPLGGSGDSSQYNVLRINPIDDITAEYVDYPEDSWDRYEIGFGLGGYISKDRLWFYGSFMPRITNTTRTATTADGTDTTQTRKQRSYFAQAKITAQPLSGLRLSLSYLNDYFKWKGALPHLDGTSSADYDYPIYGYNYPGWTVGFRADYIASDNLFFSLNGGYFHTNVEQLVGPTESRYYFQRSNIGIGAPEEHPRGWYNYGYYDGFQTTKDIQTRFTANFDGTLYMDLAGEHVLKGGVQAIRIAQDVDDGYPYDLNYYYWGLDWQSPNLGTVPTTYGYMEVRDPFGTLAKIHSMRWALFLQDSWTIANRFTLNIGIRAEKEDIPSFSDLPEYQYPPIAFDFTEKIAPRVGFAYDIFGDSSMKIFGSFGVYYDVMKLEIAEGSYGGFKWISNYYNINTLDWRYPDSSHPDESLAPDFEYIESLDWRQDAFETTQMDMKPYSKIEFTLGMQKKLGQNISFTARFLHNRILWAIEDIGVQTPEGELYFIGNPGSDWINEIYSENLGPDIPPCPKAQRKYYSVDIGLDKRFSDNWMGGFHYTWSYLWGNFAGLGSSDEFGRLSPNVERYFDGWFLHRDQNMNESTGKLPTDRPHQFKLYGSYSFDWGMTVGFSSYAMSGTPVSRMFQLGGMQGYYPEGRFTDGRTPFLTRTDLYVEYNLSLAGKYGLQFSANVTNLFNQRIARRKYAYYARQNIYLSDEEMIRGFDYREEAEKAGVQLDPKFLMPYHYTDGIDIRLGVKFIF
jgi:hypothetical protein